MGSPPVLGPSDPWLISPSPSPPPQGREFSFDDCGRAFTCLPAEDPDAPAEAPVCNLDSLLHTLTHRVRVGRAHPSTNVGLGHLWVPPAG